MKRAGWNGQCRLFGEESPTGERAILLDYFAGGGGVSHAIERALGRSPDVAINHSEAAIAMHRANHPDTMHYCMDVWDLDPERHLPPGSVLFFWASPKCTHFSRARGSAPVTEQERGDAWVMLRVARSRRPPVNMLENVPEFETWGPVGEDGKPLKSEAGAYFHEFVQAWRDLGAEPEWRVLDAADYGAPTHRKRLFFVARLDGKPVIWPEPTHGPGRAHPYRTAAECIDWSLPMLSIFATRDEAKVWAKQHGMRGIPQRPLAEPTMRRTAEGVRRFVLETDRPFLVPTDGGLVAPALVQTGYGEREGQAPRALNLHEPLGTIVAGGAKHALVAAFLQKHNGKTVGQQVNRPVDTLVATNNKSVVAATLLPEGHASGQAKLVAAFLTAYYGQGVGQRLDRPLRTVVSKDRFGLVTVEIDGESLTIGDILLRMLSPRELARCQGFADDYKLIGTNTEQVARIGNSVSPPVAESLIRANVAPLMAPPRRRLPEAAE